MGFVHQAQSLWHSINCFVNFFSGKSLAHKFKYIHGTMGCRPHNYPRPHFIGQWDCYLIGFIFWNLSIWHYKVRNAFSSKNLLNSVMELLLDRLALVFLPFLLADRLITPSTFVSLLSLEASFIFPV